MSATGAVLTYQDGCVGVLGSKGRVLEVMEGRGFIGLVPREKEKQGERTEPMVLSFCNPIPMQAWAIGWEAVVAIHREHNSEGVVHFYQSVTGGEEAVTCVAVPKQEVSGAHVEADKQEEERVQEQAAQAGMILKGTLHLHPWEGAQTASGIDTSGWKDVPGVHGIANLKGEVVVYLCVRGETMEAERFKVELSDENVKMILERGLEALVWVPAGGKIEDQAIRKRYELSLLECGEFDFGFGKGQVREVWRGGRGWSYEGERDKGDDPHSSRERERERDMFDGFPVRGALELDEQEDWDQIRKSLCVVRRLLKRVKRAADRKDLSEDTSQMLQFILGGLEDEEDRLLTCERAASGLYPYKEEEEDEEEV